MVYMIKNGPDFVRLLQSYNEKKKVILFSDPPCMSQNEVFCFLQISDRSVRFYPTSGVSFSKLEAGLSFKKNRT